ncbi:hypothetical protein QAD02_015015 [Eretmocerus hayati]|uniref:Uncharacterized protein n=1 Tax=Eretmocerus hayati TaxID=131215 RepID=A0ACC2P809_9HYME|nr:hypothetical protein QAD02_015015 [Eretmocerus hayati]
MNVEALVWLEVYDAATKRVVELKPALSRWGLLPSDYVFLSILYSFISLRLRERGEKGRYRVAELFSRTLARYILYSLRCGCNREEAVRSFELREKRGKPIQILALSDFWELVLVRDFAEM